MSSSWPDPDETPWPEDAPGPTDVPSGDGEAKHKTGERRAAKNREEDPPA
jgi:hypothetical protein